ncbi:MAG: Hsp20/alpha crystallin family protein [bacterium]|nr:Hsp20/alpha crystallin family protein [bacterium]
MKLIKWTPFDTIDRFFDETFPVLALPKVSGDMAVDVYDDKDNVYAEMNLAGIDPEKVDISVEENYLKVTGSREEKEEKKEKNYYTKEIRTGSFERTIRLPFAVEKNKSQAEYKNGQLKIILPKKQEEKSEKIKIKVA